MLEIVPAVLAYDEEDFRARLLHPGLRHVAPLWHVDILDGSMFGTTCWADPTAVGQWSNLPDIELHIMSQNPLPHYEAWHAHVNTIRNVIIHAEIARPLGAIAERLTGVERTLALNPETDVDVPHAHYHFFDRVQIMGIHPGVSGAPFLGEPILAKIRRFIARYPEFAQNDRVAIDGGVNHKNIAALAHAGVTRCVAGSALWAHEDPVVAYHALRAVVQEAENLL